MKDRFKFRVWHKPLKQMHYNDFIVTATGYMAKIYQQDDYMMKFNQEDLEFDKQCILMQCTGLKDKNGKLIYEGDILGGIYHGYIEYCKDCKCFQLFVKDYGCLACEGDIHWYELVESENENELEVIGNIYENKELLDEMNEIEKMYKNANVEDKNINNQLYKDLNYPQFTAEKQLELIKFMLQKGIYYDTDGDTYWFHYTDEIENAKYRPFKEAISEFINGLWQDLIEEEKEQVKEILNE